MLTVSRVGELERERYDAMRHHDVERLSRLLGTTMRYTHTNAQSDSRRDYLRKVADGTYVYHSIEVAEQQITIVENTALVFVRMTADITSGGVKLSVDNRALAVWVDTAEGCFLYAYQPIKIPQS